MRRSKLFIAISVLSLALAACGGQAPTPSATRPPASSALPATPSSQPAATSAATPSSQPAATSAATPTVAATEQSQPLPTTQIGPPTATPAFPEQVISAETIARLQPFRVVGFGGALRATLSPDNSTLAVATTAGVAWFEYPSLRHLRLDPFEAPIYGLEFTAEGDVLWVFLSETYQSTIVELRVADGAELKRSPTLQPEPQITIPSPSGLLEARLQVPDASPVPGVSIVRRDDGETLYQDEHTLTASFSADEQMAVLVTFDNRVRVVRLDDGTSVELPVLGYWGAGFSPDGQTLVTSGRQVHLWNVLDGSLQRTLASPGQADSAWVTGAMQRVRYGAGGSVLNVEGVYYVFEGSLWQGTAWQVKQGSVGERLWVNNAQGPNLGNYEAYVGAISPASNYVAYTLDGITLQIDEAGSSSYTLKVPGKVGALEFSPDGSLLAIADKEGSVQLVASADGTVANSFSTGQHSYKLVFSLDGSLLGAKGSNGEIQIWRPGDQSPRARIRHQTEEFMSAVYSRTNFIFTADNQLLIVAGEQSVRFYQLSDGREIGSLPVRAKSLAIGPFKRALAITLESGQVQLWGVG